MTISAEHLAIPSFDYQGDEPNEKTFNRTKKIVNGILETFRSIRLSIVRLGGFGWNSWSLIIFFRLAGTA